MFSGYIRVSSFVNWVQNTIGSDGIKANKSTFILKETTKNEAATIKHTNTMGVGAITAALKATPCSDGDAFSHVLKIN